MQAGDGVFSEFEQRVLTDVCKSSMPIRERNLPWRDARAAFRIRRPTTFWSVWTWAWRFNHWFGWTAFGFEAVWTDRLTELGKVSFVAWPPDRLDADVAFWKRFGRDKSMVQSGLSPMSLWTWSAIRNTVPANRALAPPSKSDSSSCVHTQSPFLMGL